MTRFEILPLHHTNCKVDGYYIFDNETKSYWRDHSGEVYFTKSKRVAIEIASSLNGVAK